MQKLLFWTINIEDKNIDFVQKLEVENSLNSLHAIIRSPKTIVGAETCLKIIDFFN